MPARTNSAPPDILCTCKATRVYPLRLGLPPIGTETMCIDCGRMWTLDSYTFDDTGGTRWSWTSEDQPDTKVKAANTLVRTLIGIDAMLEELGLLAESTKGTC